MYRILDITRTRTCYMVPKYIHGTLRQRPPGWRRISSIIYRSNHRPIALTTSCVQKQYVTNRSTCFTVGPTEALKPISSLWTSRNRDHLRSKHFAL